MLLQVIPNSPTGRLHILPPIRRLTQPLLKSFPDMLDGVLLYGLVKGIPESFGQSLCIKPRLLLIGHVTTSLYNLLSNRLQFRFKNPHNTNSLNYSIPWNLILSYNNIIVNL
jgi:hypothetical protein